MQAASRFSAQFIEQVQQQSRWPSRVRDAGTHLLQRLAGPLRVLGRRREIDEFEQLGAEIVVQVAEDPFPLDDDGACALVLDLSRQSGRPHARVRRGRLRGDAWYGAIPPRHPGPAGSVSRATAQGPSIAVPFYFYGPSPQPSEDSIVTKCPRAPVLLASCGVPPELTDLPVRSILTVDDHAPARAWLRAAVAAAFPHCAIVEAACCAEALESLQAVRFELVLLDLGLPDGSGLQVLEELRRRQPDCPCVITTVFDDDEHLFKALRAGAAGYVLKDQSQHELGELLRQMLEGRPPMSPAIARDCCTILGSPPAAPPPAVPTPTADAEPQDALTGREQDVLRIVAKGLSIREAAAMLAISPHTVHTHVRTVYRKLAVGTRAEAALAASRLGLV